ncbi:hypothetical protein Tco_1037422, partial [Tanacetum coccineum]
MPESEVNAKLRRNNNCCETDYNLSCSQSHDLEQRQVQTKYGKRTCKWFQEDPSTNPKTHGHQASVRRYTKFEQQRKKTTGMISTNMIAYHVQLRRCKVAKDHVSGLCLKVHECLIGGIWLDLASLMIDFVDLVLFKASDKVTMSLSSNIIKKNVKFRLIDGEILILRASQPSQELHPCKKTSFLSGLKETNGIEQQPSSPTEPMPAVFTSKMVSPIHTFFAMVMWLGSVHLIVLLNVVSFLLLPLHKYFLVLGMFVVLMFIPIDENSKWGLALA